jgi:hypothetical protein
MRTLLWLLLAAGAIAAAEFTEPPRLTPNPNPQAPLAAVLRFSSSEPAETLITISSGAFRHQLRYPPERKPEEGLPVVGMRPGQRHYVAVAIRDAHGRATNAPAALEYTPPALPPGMPPIRVQAQHKERMEPGFTLVSARTLNPKMGLLVAIDAEGEIVWVYRTGSRISDFERRRNGNLLLCTLDFEILEIDMLGNTVARWYAKGRPKGAGEAIPVDTMTFHHEIDELPNGNLLVLGTSVREIPDYYTSETDPRAPRKAQKVMGDQVIEFTRAGGVVWKWDAFDHLDAFRIGYETFSGYWERRGFPGVVDWSHANNLLYDERDDSILVSFRYQSAIVKVDHKTGRAIWILGKPEGWSERFRDKLFRAAGNTRWFHHQHAPFPTPAGTILVFDNGNYQTLPFDPPLPPSKTYSRAAEYQLDEKKRRARQIWESESGPGPDSVVSMAMGNAEKMPRTGNILVSYGALLDHPGEKWDSSGGRWTRIREYTHTRPARLVWEAVIRDPSGKEAWQSFCSTRWASFTPGAALEKPPHPRQRRSN